MSEQALGPTHPDTALSLWWIPTLLTAAGDRAGARARLQCALVIYTHALGPAHPTTQQCQRKLAALDDPDAATPKALRVYGAAGHLVSAALSVSPPLRAALRAYRSDAPPFPTQLI